MLLPALQRFLRGFMLLAALVGALSMHAGGALEGRMTFRAFGNDEGLTTSTVWAMLADRAGFMWVGSENGLYRYDGNRFMVFGVKDGLPSHFVWSLHQSADGALWAGTYKGLARLKGDRFERVPLGPEDASPEVAALASGPQGRLWVATSSGPYLQGSDGAFQPVTGWPGGAVTALWAKPDSARVWAASWSKGQARILAWQGGVWTVCRVAKELAGSRLDALAVDGEQRVWARSLKQLWQLNPTDQAFRPATLPVPPARQRGHLFVDRSGCLWVTTERGLVRLAKDGPQWITRAMGLPEGNLTSVMEDREGTLWISGSGVYHLQGGGAWRSYGPELGLPAGAVWCILRTRDGRRLAGTDQGLFQEGPARWSLVPGTSGMQVRTIVEGADQALYLAGSPEILRLGPGRARPARFGPDDGVVLSGGRIYRLLMDPAGTLWVATDKGGLLRGTPSGRGVAFQRVDVPMGGPLENFNDLCLDGAGRLWAAGDQGLLVLERGQWRRFTTRDGLRHNHVTYLHPTRDGHLVYSYFEALGLGLATCDASGFHVLKHLDDTFSPDKVVYLMGEDARNNFWVGTGQGLDRVNHAQQVEHFGRKDGLTGEDTNSMAFLADPDGDVWIGTSFGLAHFKASHDLGVPEPPRCVLLACRLGGRAVALQDQAQLKAPSRASAFEAEFSGLSFVKDGEINYQTRMVGLESEWHGTLTSEVRYPALPPGAYRFEVQARIGQGRWSPPAAVRFEVLPAWWQRWSFRILGSLATLALGAVGAWVRLAALQRRNRTLEKMVAERTRELAQANDQLKSQSLTDPLTGLKNRRFLGLCMPEDVAQVNRVHHTTLRHGSARMALNVDMVFIMVDLDHFKDVNDHYGHAAGDRVLQDVAELLKAATRDTDTIVRWGGEEFLVVARHACRGEAGILMERILTLVAEHPFQIGDGRVIHCTCSLGFTFYPFIHDLPDLLSWERLLDLSDHCLYAAKRGGRNAWVGLYPTEEAEPDLLRDRIPFGIGELLWRQQVQARTSLPGDVVLEWDGSAS